MNTATATSNDVREEIVDKLHGALAAFRRERDELHRKRDMATERVRLVKEEKEAMEKTIHSMQEKLNQLNKSGSEEAKRELEGMEKEVEKLRKEAQYQHTELLAKRNKIAELTTKMTDGAEMREASIRAAQAAIKIRKEKIAASEKKQKDLATFTNAPQQVERFKQEMQHETDVAHLVSRCPILIEQNAAAIMMDACDIHRETVCLTRIVQGYQQRFGELPSALSSVDISNDIRT